MPHTNEPWKYEERMGKIYEERFAQDWGMAPKIAQTFDITNPPQDRRVNNADGNRIVACVNACVGITDFTEAYRLLHPAPELGNPVAAAPYDGNVAASLSVNNANFRNQASAVLGALAGLQTAGIQDQNLKDAIEGIQRNALAVSRLP